MADDVARGCARALARFEDPELDLVGAGLPATIRLLPLLDLDECTPEAVLARWKAAGPDPRPATPVGLAEDGVFSIDFVADGPHALVGGTTGAGKSELLRSMVAGLAASVDPDHLTFVLVDFKGGSAFDECAKLPHTVGMVTDLDEHLAERALRCLEAELKHRERTLRDVGRHRPARLPAQGPARAHAPPARHHRRVRHAQGRAAPVHRRPGRRGPAGPQPRRPHAARHPAAAGGDQRQHPGQHQHAHRPADAGHERLEGRHRRARRRGHPPHGARAGPTCASDPGEVVAIQSALSTGTSTGAVDRPRRRRPVRLRARAAAAGPRAADRPRPRRPRPASVPAASPRPTCRCWSPPSARRSPARAGRPPAARGPTRCPATSTSTRSSTPAWPARPDGAPPTVFVAMADDPDAQTAVPGGLGAGRRQPHRLRPRRQRHDDGAHQRRAEHGPAAPARRPARLRPRLRRGRARGPRPRCPTWAGWCWRASASARPVWSATCAASSTAAGPWERPRRGPSRRSSP